MEGVVGKYVEQCRAGTNLVLLDADVAQAFPNDAAVNEALRMLIQIAQRQQLNTVVSCVASRLPMVLERKRGRRGEGERI